MSNDTFERYYEHACDVVKNDLMSASFRGRPEKFIKRVIIIGAGGTGSWFSPKFTKIINDAINKNLISFEENEKLNVLYIDGDIVEDKNLIRQNFIEFDVGKNKAEVLATRYGSQFNEDKVECGYISKYITNKDYRKIDPEVSDRFIDISDILSSTSGSSLRGNEVLFINLIDNAVTRKIIHLTAMDCSKAVVLDVANNEHNGQLTCSIYGQGVRSYTSGDIISGWFYNSIPEQLTHTDDVSVFSCADADENSEDQLFSANDMAATVLANYINTWLVEKKIDNARVDFNTGSRAFINPSMPLFKPSVVYRRSLLDNRDVASHDFIKKVIAQSGINLENLVENIDSPVGQRGGYREMILKTL